MEEQILKDINGNDFLFRTLDSSCISVLDPGYIINLTGAFINVKDDEDHSDIFSAYLTKYLNSSVPINLSSIEAAMKLVELNHIIYFGIKTNDSSNVYNKGQNDGYGIIIIPEIEKITDEQKRALVKLVDTNKSIFGGNKEKLELEIHTADDQEELDLKDIINNFKNSLISKGK